MRMRLCETTFPFDFGVREESWRGEGRRRKKATTKSSTRHHQSRGVSHECELFYVVFLRRRHRPSFFNADYNKVSTCRETNHQIHKWIVR